MVLVSDIVKALCTSVFKRDAFDPARFFPALIQSSVLQPINHHTIAALDLKPGTIHDDGQIPPRQVFPVEWKHLFMSNITSPTLWVSITAEYSLSAQKLA